MSMRSDRIGICKCWFLRRGENQSTQRKLNLSEQGRKPTTNSTHISRGSIQHYFAIAIKMILNLSNVYQRY